jgi:hypothetical protein
MLWAKACGRCSICHVLLVTEGTDEEDKSLFGYESYIESGEAGAARYAVLADYDLYDNLILLCSPHRDAVDGDPRSYPASRLRQIRTSHAQWVEKLADDQLIRLVPDPTRPIPMRPHAVSLASSLWNFMGDAQIFYPGWPDGLTREQEAVISAFVADLARWRDVAAVKGNFQLSRDAARQLAAPFGAMGETGLLVSARERQCLLLRFTLDPLPMRVIYLDIVPAAAPQDRLPNDVDLVPQLASRQPGAVS